MVDIATLGLDVDTRRLRPAVREVNRFTDTMRGAERQAQTMGSTVGRTFGQLAAVVGIGAAVSAVSRAAEAYTNTTNRLKAMGASAESAAAQFAELTQVANATRAPIQSVADLYTRLQLSAKGLGASQQQLMAFTNAVGLALGTSGSSAAQASGALTQLSQALAGGVVRAEEFNSIVEGAPGILIAAANGIAGVGGDLGKLRAMMLDGKLTSDVFFNGLLSQTGALEAAFARTTPTISQAFAVLNNNFTAMVGKFDSITGASAGVANALLAVGENLDRIAVYGATAAAIFGGAYVAGLVAARVATLGLSGALGVLRGALLRTGIGAVVVAAGELIYRFTGLIEKTGSFGGAMTVLKNVAAEVFGRMGVAGQAVGAMVTTVAYEMAWSFLSAFRSMATAAQQFFATTANGLKAIPGMEGIHKTFYDISSSMALGVSKIEDGVSSMRGLADASQETADGLIAAATAPLESLKGLSGAMAENAESADALAGVVGSGGKGKKGKKGLSDAAKEAKRALEELRSEAEAWTERTATPVEKYRKEIEKLGVLLAMKDGISPETYRRAVDQLNDELVESKPIIGDVADAFGDWISGGLRDFKGFVSTVLGSFKSMLSKMIATAAMNPIKIAMGVAAGGSPAVAGGVPGAGAGMGGLPGMGGIGGILGGVGGLMGGIGNGFGAVISGFMSNGLSGAGAVINSAVTGISGASTAIGGLGAAIGAVAAPLAAVGLIFAAFKSKTKLLDSGIRVTVDGMDSMIETFKKVEKSRFFGISKSKSKKYSDADAALADPISGAITQILTGIGDGVSALGLDSKRLGNVAYDFEVSTKGKSDVEIQAAIEEQIGAVSDIAIRAVAGTALDRFQGAEERLADTLNRMVGNLAGVNDVLDQLQAKAMASSVAGAAAATAMAEAAGGLQGLASAASTFMAEFWTEGERMASATSRVSDALASIGVAMPKTRAEFRAIVDAIDTTTVSGAELYGQMLSLSGSFAAVVPTLGLLTPALDSLRTDLISQVDGMIGKITEIQTEETRAARDWKAAAGRIRGFVADMKSTVGPGRTGMQARASLEAEYQTLLARAMAGDIEAVAQVTQVADRLVGLAGDQAKTQLEAAAVQGRIMGDLSGIGVLASVEAERHAILAAILGDQAVILTEVRDVLMRGDELTAGAVAALQDKVNGVGITLAAADKASLAVLKSYATTGLHGLAAMKEIGLSGRIQIASLAGLRAMAEKLPGGLAGALSGIFGDQFGRISVGFDGLKGTLHADLSNIGHGLGKLRVGLADSAQRVVDAINRQATLGNLQAALTDAAASRDANIAGAESVIGAIRSLEATTGGVLQNKSSQGANILVGNGGITTDMAWLAGNSSAMAAFREKFWNAGGLEDQLEGASGAIKRDTATINKLRGQIAALGAIPAFAKGGDHEGGARLVGERGPEIEVTGPARYLSAQKTRDMLGGRQDNAELVAEVRLLRSENRQLGMAMAKNTRATAKVLEEWNRVGQPETRDLTA